MFQGPFPRETINPRAVRVYGQVGMDSKLPNGGSPGPNQNGFDQPDGVSMDDENQVYVLDAFNHRVLVFRGEETRPFDVIGQTNFNLNTPTTNLNGFWFPSGISHGLRGLLAVADQRNKRVLLFQKGQKIAFKAITQWEPGSDIDQPNDVHIDINNNM